MAGAGELVGDDRDSRIHQEMKSMGLQQVESFAAVEAKFDASLKVLVESNTQLQLTITTGTNYKNDEEKQKAAPNPSSSPLPQPALVSSTTSALLTPEEHTITITAAADNLDANMKRPTILNDIQEESAEDGCQVMSEDHDILDGYEELYWAARNGDLKLASKFLKKNPEAITKVIASDSRTVLHVAVIEGNLMFIEEIVKRMPAEILEYKTGTNGYTALHYAALCGYAKAAEVLVKKNSKLTQIEDRFRRIPLLLALISVTGRQRGTVEYLYSVTRHEHPSPFSGNQGDSLLCHMIDAGYYDIASYLVQRFPELVIDQTKKVQTSAMNNMAEKPFAFASGAKHTFWQRRMYSLIKVDLNTAYELDRKRNQGNSSLSSEENLPQSLEGTTGDKLKMSKWEIIEGCVGCVFMVILVVPYCIYLMIRTVVSRHRETVVEVDTQTDKKISEKSLLQNSEGTNRDEENPVDRIEASCEEEKNPPENLVTAEGDKAKSSNTVVVVDIIVTVILMVTYAAIFVVPFVIYLMIKFFVYLFSFIPWSPVTHIKQVHKQLYEDKKKHKQAEALVKTIFTTLQERMNKQEVEAFFKGSNIMKMAIRHGSVEIVKECIKLFPYLIWTQMGGQNMIHMAIAERNKTILDLICKESGKIKVDLVSRCDEKDNTILHYAAKLAPSAQLNSVCGAYLQMQREKQWFKGVEYMIAEKDRFKRNENGDTAHNIFTKEHKELKESGEKWLKDTSGSCMVVAALIATVAFTSIFTVPGGNISESNSSSKVGTPVFLRNNIFMVFAVADALALFSSITSVLMFLTVYTSRYAEVDFLKSLPHKLILGLTTLFVSMASVLVAFGASLYLVLGDRFKWVLIPIVVFSCLPVTLFGWLQVPLFFDMIRSTYWGRLFREHTYISSQQLNSKEEIQYNKLVTFVDGFENYFEKLVSKKFHRLTIDG